LEKIGLFPAIGQDTGSNLHNKAINIHQETRTHGHISAKNADIVRTVLGGQAQNVSAVLSQ